MAHLVAAGPGEVDENGDTRRMAAALDSHAPNFARVVTCALVAGLLLGFGAQLLRQIDGPVMKLGGALAPWLAVGFLLAIWASRERRFRAGSWLGIATMGIYLLAWLFAYHATFAIRESVAQASAWREAAPWVLLAGPVSIVLGVVAAATHRNGAVGDASLAVPIALALPELALFVKEGPSHIIVVALPTFLVALSPLLVVGRRDVNFLRVAVACIMLGIAGLIALPLVRSFIHS